MKVVKIIAVITVVAVNFIIMKKVIIKAIIVTT